MKVHRGILAVSIALVSLSASLAAAARPEPGTMRHYCTQYGPFSIRFDADKAAGIFAILTNGDLGSMVGTINGTTLNGQWIEVDSKGEIRLEFSDDWSTFEATYNLAADPGTWHANWTGRLRPEADPARFTVDDVEYRCR